MERVRSQYGFMIQANETRLTNVEMVCLHPGAAEKSIFTFLAIWHGRLRQSLHKVFIERT